MENFLRENQKKIILLIFIPLVFIFLVLNYSKAKGPFWSGPNIDPDYGYLLNSLNVARLKSPCLNDHPGTPVETFGAPVIWATHLIDRAQNNNSDLITDLLTNPEKFLTVLQRATLGLIALSIFLVGFLSFFLFQNLVWSLFLQAAPFFSFSAFYEITKFSPEPFLFFTSQLLVILILFCLISEPTLIHALLLGTILGFGVANKVTFLPLLAFIFLMPNLKLKKLCCLAFGLSAFVFTIPMIKRYPVFWNFISAVATHKGIYGNGEKGFIDLTNVFGRFKSVIDQDPSFFLCFAVCAATLLFFLSQRKKYFGRSKNRLDNSIPKVAVITLVACFGQIVMVAKHPAGARYMLPAMGLAGLLIFLCLQIFTKIEGQKARMFRNTFYLLMACCVFISINQVRHSMAEFQSKQSDLKRLEEVRNGKFKDCKVAYLYLSSSLAIAYQLGNRTACGIYSDKLHEIYGDLITYDILTGQFANGLVQVPLEELEKKGCVLLQGTPFIGSRAEYLPKFEIHLLHNGAAEALYKIGHL